MLQVALSVLFASLAADAASSCIRACTMAGLTTGRMVSRASLGAARPRLVQIRHRYAISAARAWGPFSRETHRRLESSALLRSRAASSSLRVQIRSYAKPNLPGSTGRGTRTILSQQGFMLQSIPHLKGTQMGSYLLHLGWRLSMQMTESSLRMSTCSRHAHRNFACIARPAIVSCVHDLGLLP